MKGTYNEGSKIYFMDTGEGIRDCLISTRPVHSKLGDHCLKWLICVLKGTCQLTKVLNYAIRPSEISSTISLYFEIAFSFVHSIYDLVH